MTEKELKSLASEYYRRNKSVFITAELCGTSPDTIVKILGIESKAALRRKFGEKFVSDACRPILKNKKSIRKVAEDLNVDFDVVKAWVEYEKIKTGMKVVQHPEYTEKFKEKVGITVLTRKAGVSVAMIAAHYGVPVQTAQNWANCERAKQKRRCNNVNG